MTIDVRLREERNRIGLNQPDFAALGGKTKKTLIDYEKGKTSPDAEFLAAIAAAGADVQYILTGVGSGAALASDERLLLERYRTSPQPLKDAALRVLLGGEASAPAFSIKGDVGQSIHSPQGGTFKADMRKERKK